MCMLCENWLTDLAYIRVRPYYIYQCDLSLGLSHFRTISKGLEIIEGLRGTHPASALPTYVDAPGGGGKIPGYAQLCYLSEPRSCCSAEL